MLALTLLSSCVSPPPPREPSTLEIELDRARQGELLADLGREVLALRDDLRGIMRLDWGRAKAARGAAETAAALRARAAEIHRERLGAEAGVDLDLVVLYLEGIDTRLSSARRDEDELRAVCPTMGDLERLDPGERYLPPDELAEGVAALGRIAAAEIPGAPTTGIPDRILARLRSRLGQAPSRVRGWCRTAEKSGLPPGEGAGLRDRAIARLDALLKGLGDAPEQERSAWPAAAGREQFVRNLRQQHLVTASPEEIAAAGRRILSETEEMMRALVEESFPGKTVAEALEALKDEAPTADELPVIAYEAMTAARDFVIDRGLVTVPEDLREAIVRPVGDRMSRTFPFGAYGGSTWIAGRNVGVYLISPGASWMTEEQHRERLRGNHPAKTRVVALHEMWPGHHLQRGYQRRNRNPLRTRMGTNTYVEGWGLYSEELLYRHGYYEDPRVRLAQLDMRRWRACRVILDPSLHCSWMTPEEGVELLMEHAGFERTNAEAEVRRYLGNPTRPFSYIWGWIEIERIRKKALARGLTEREFHDRFLEAGPIPLPLVERLLLEE